MLKIFLWAMLHHPDFRYCQIDLPITLRWSWFETLQGRVLRVDFRFQPVSVYVPYSVREAYWRSQGLEADFDDIPF